MNNPRDFLPAKYKKNQDELKDFSVESTSDMMRDEKPEERLDSPWSDLGKEPEIPEYRNNDILDVKEEENKDFSATLNSNHNALLKEEKENTPKSAFVPKKKKNFKLAGLLVVFFLVVGIFSSYMLSQQNQDNRQQASGGGTSDCDPATDPYCSCYGSVCFIDDPNDGCGDNMNKIGNNCYNMSCHELDNGSILCGFDSEGNPCTEDSMGGDWCDNPNTSSVETCEEAGLMRCQCSAGSGGGWWVIGSSDEGCDGLCGDANANCSDCDNPCEGDDCNPTEPPTGTPTAPPVPLNCGETGCNQNSDCATGLTCQTITNATTDSITKICSRGENQLFCAANPTTANCCTSQAIPVCASIEMLDSTNTAMTGDDDAKLKSGDEVRFRCSAAGNQDVSFDYQFRVWAPGTSSWIDITDTSGTVANNISDSYVITNLGHYVAQGRICVGTDCQVWETVAGSPNTISSNPN